MKTNYSLASFIERITEKQAGETNEFMIKSVRGDGLKSQFNWKSDKFIETPLKIDSSLSKF